MTCREFDDHLDRLLARDAQSASSRDRSMSRHAVACPRCRALWRQARPLTRDTPELMTRRAVAGGTRAARDRLRTAFTRAGHPPVAFSSLRTPIGRVFVATSDLGVCDITFDAANEDRYRARLAARAPEITRDRDAVAFALEELDAYFAGTLNRFTAPIDLRGVTDFTRRVLRATRGIPFGRLRSYGEVARRIGSPGASRAVGGALGRNPVPIIVPCHRVIAGGGRIGGFTGGVATKRALLRIEGHEPA